MNESISTAAGAGHGQVMTPSALRRAIRDAGRVPVQRSTKYDALRTFAAAHDDDEAGDPLDAIRDTDEAFGTYAALTRDGRFRFQLKRAPRTA